MKKIYKGGHTKIMKTKHFLKIINDPLNDEET